MGHGPPYLWDIATVKPFRGCVFGVPMAHQFKLYEDARKEFRWNLLADNQHIIAVSS